MAAWIYAWLKEGSWGGVGDRPFDWMAGLESEFPWGRERQKKGRTSGREAVTQQKVG